MNLLTRLAQKRWKQEGAGCRELGGYRSHELNHRLYDSLTSPYCRFCGTELHNGFDDNMETRVRPRWSTRMLGWFGGLKGDWWKGEK